MEAPRRFPVGAPRFLPCLHSGRGNLFPLFFMSQSITIIGIDPGSRNTGWGVVREVSGVLQLVDCGVIRLRLTESSLPGSGSSLRKCIGCSAV